VQGTKLGATAVVREHSNVGDVAGEVNEKLGVALFVKRGGVLVIVNVGAAVRIATLAVCAGPGLLAASVA
jgi:hypothetical protein